MVRSGQGSIRAPKEGVREGPRRPQRLLLRVVLRCPIFGQIRGDPGRSKWAPGCHPTPCTPAARRTDWLQPMARYLWNRPLTNSDQLPGSTSCCFLSAAVLLLFCCLSVVLWWCCGGGGFCAAQMKSFRPQGTCQGVSLTCTSLRFILVPNPRGVNLKRAACWQTCEASSSNFKITFGWPKITPTLNQKPILSIIR